MPKQNIAIMQPRYHTGLLSLSSLSRMFYMTFRIRDDQSEMERNYRFFFIRLFFNNLSFFLLFNDLNWSLEWIFNYFCIFTAISWIGHDFISWISEKWFHLLNFQKTISSLEYNSIKFFEVKLGVEGFGQICSGTDLYKKVCAWKDGCTEAYIGKNRKYLE